MELNSRLYTVEEITHKLNYINPEYTKILQKNAVELARQGLFKCRLDFIDGKNNTIVEVYDWDKLISAIEDYICARKVN